VVTTDMANPYSSDEEKAVSKLRHRTNYGKSRVTVYSHFDSATEGFFIDAGPSVPTDNLARVPNDAGGGGFIDVGPDY
jgi:hypothetical protein